MRLRATVCVASVWLACRFAAGQQAAVEDDYSRALAYFRQGQLAEARPFLEKATALSPTSQDTWQALSLVLLGLKDFPGAVPALQHACELAKGEEDACYLLGRTLFLLARYDEALKPFEKALRDASAVDKAKVERAAALNLDQLGNAAEAERHFHAAIRAYRAGGGVRSHEDPRLDYGAFLVRQGRAAEAVEPLEQAVAAFPLSPQANAELGRALLDLDRAQEALPLLQKAVELDPKAWTVRMLLGKAYLRLGRSEEGERELRLGREGWASGNHAPDNHAP
jgi:tetratricopeptide (TPR) repeat protein